MKKSPAAIAFDLALETEGLTAVQKLCLMRGDMFPRYQTKLRRERSHALGMEDYVRHPKTGRLQGQLTLNLF